MLSEKQWAHICRLAILNKEAPFQKRISGGKRSEKTKLKMSIASRRRWSKKEERDKVSRENSKFWKGGIFYHPSGYILYIGRRQHRLIMENHLGRKLSVKEVVHHNNGDKHDNRIENLTLFKNQKEHLEHHYNKRKNVN